MWRQRALTALFLILALILPLGVAADDPPGPTTRHQQRADGLPMTGPAEMVTWVLEFAPGAQSPPHTHPGRILVTVLEGEVTIRMEGTEHTYKQGESFVEEPGIVHLGANTGSTKTRNMVSILLPKGAPQSQTQPGGPSPAPPAPTPLYVIRAEALVPAGPYELAQVVLDFAPGAQTPQRSHPGQAFTTVLAGEVILLAGGAEKVYKAGESFIEQPRVIGQVRNAGTAPVTLLTTYLLPKGAPLSTPVATPGLPNTGAGGTAYRWSLPMMALLIGTLLLAGGWGLRRRLDRS